MELRNLSFRIVAKWNRVSGLTRALQHVPPRSLYLRLRREFRVRLLLRNPRRFNNPIASSDVRNPILQNLQSSSFLSMAERVAELSRSSFSYEHAARTLHFIGSGDRVALIDVQRVAWTVKGGIPASDVNRCWFMSFAEQATFLSGNPETDITELCHYVRQLTEAAPLVSSILPIPWQPLSAARRIINLLAALSLLLRADPLLAVSKEASFLIDHLFLHNRVATYLREDDLGYNHLATELFAQTLFACVGWRKIASIVQPQTSSYP